MGKIKLVKGKYSRSVDEIWKTEHYVDDVAMIEAIHAYTHLPRWICRRVYEAEANILFRLGLLK